MTARLAPLSGVRHTPGVTPTATFPHFTVREMLAAGAYRTRPFPAAPRRGSPVLREARTGTGNVVEK